MISLRLHDRNFTGSTSSSLYHSPERLEWLREGPNTPTTFFTDLCLEDGVTARADFKVAWILEPAEINAAPYRFVEKHLDAFDLVLTHHAEYLRRWGTKAAFYPNGMSWIATDDWRVHEKTRLTSIIASDKMMTKGHRLRHQIIKDAQERATRDHRDLGDLLSVFGRAYRPVKHKVEALGPYRFSVVIENSAAPWYFTEKLLDCFATHTIPIYWGCPGIAKFFDTEGMIVVSSKEDALDALGRVSGALYDEMLSALKGNHERAKQYRVAEDWIVDQILRPRGLG